MHSYFGEILRLRYFWLALVRSDLRNRYRRSMIGIGWSLLQPIAMTIVLCTVFSRLFEIDTRTYAPFLLTGLTVWSFLVTVIVQGCHSFLLGESYIRQCPAPLAIYPLRIVLGAGVHLLLGLSVVTGLTCCLLGLSNVLALLSLVPTLVLLFVLGWALATCMAAINVMFQDTQHLAEVLIQILFYITPIMYTTELLAQRKLDWLVWFNPVTVFLDLVRQPFLQGQFPAPATFAVAAAVTAVAASFAALTMWRLERRIVLYL